MRKCSKAPKIVLVRWEDPTRDNSGWISKKISRTITPLECQTVGCIVKRNTRRLIIAASFCRENDTVADLMSIPARCVKKVTRLR